ncbi:hypothetical protein D3C86_1769570 [compost metagenome]
MLQIVGDVRVASRNGLFEAGIELQAQRAEAQQDGDQHAQTQHQDAVVEHGAFERIARARIKVFEPASAGLSRFHCGHVIGLL